MYLHMDANIQRLDKIKRELADNDRVCKCAERFGNTGDPTSMKACYLLHHYPELSVSQLAGLVGVSISAMSRCLHKLNRNEIVISHKQAQTVYYSLQNNSFTRALVHELERGEE